jgi:hypothetical protein
VAEDLARVLPDAAQLAARGNLGDVVVVIYLTGKLAYRMLDILLMIAVSGFLGVPFPLLWALWVGIVDFLPMIGGALAGIPTVLFALAHSLTAGLVTAAVFVAYQQLENHVLNPLIMSRTVNVSPLLVLMAVLLGTSLGDWAGGVFGGFVAALISVPCAAALQVVVKEIWRNTALSSGALAKIGQANTARDINVFVGPQLPDGLLSATGIRRQRGPHPGRECFVSTTKDIREVVEDELSSHVRIPQPRRRPVAQQHLACPEQDYGNDAVVLHRMSMTCRGAPSP